jgi:hypothetical protein
MVAEEAPPRDKGKHTRDRKAYPRQAGPCNLSCELRLRWAPDDQSSLPMAFSTQLTRRMMNSEIEPMTRKMTIGVA